MISSYHLYLTGTKASLRSQTGLSQRIKEVAHWQWDGNDPSSLELVPDIAGRFGTGLHVYVGSALSQFIALELPNGLLNIEEQRVAAKAQMQSQLGLNVGEWDFAISLQHGSNTVIVCAVRRNLLERVRELARGLRLRLVSFRPYIVGVWDSVQTHQRSNSVSSFVLLALEDDAFTVFVAEDYGIIAMNSMQHTRETGLVDREIKRLGYTLPIETLNKICIAIPGGGVGLAAGHLNNLVSNSEFLARPIYADFRDLLFSTNPEEGDL
jgi:hypothetical protein